MFDIRQICSTFKEVHSRYYVDTNGTIYTSLSPSTSRVTINGERVAISGFKNENLRRLDKNSQMMVRFEESEYFLLYDGTILRRMKTQINPQGEIVVSIIRVRNGNERGNSYTVSRLVAGVFIRDVTGLEVHHIDRNRKNNNVDNLEVLSFEEHRSKKTFKQKHSLTCND